MVVSISILLKLGTRISQPVVHRALEDHMNSKNVSQD